MSGTTIGRNCSSPWQKKLAQAQKNVQLLQQKHPKVVQELFDSSDHYQKGDILIKHHFKTIQNDFGAKFDATTEKIILAQGELLSTNLLHLYLQEQQI